MPLRESLSFSSVATNFAVAVAAADLSTLAGFLPAPRARGDAERDCCISHRRCHAGVMKRSWARPGVDDNKQQRPGGAHPECAPVSFFHDSLTAWSRMDDLDERVASLALREDEEQRRLALLAAAHQQHQQHHQQQHQQQAYQQAGDTLAFGDHTLRKVSAQSRKPTRETQRADTTKQHRSQRFTVPTYTSQSYAPPPFAPPSLPLSSGFSQPPLGFGEPSVDLTQRTLHTARSTTGLSSAFAAGSQPEDEVIPTAIVIKNIP